MLFRFSSYQEKCSKHPRSAANNILKNITIFWQPMSGLGVDLYGEGDVMLSETPQYHQRIHTGKEVIGHMFECGIQCCIRTKIVHIQRNSHRFISDYFLH